MLALWNLIKSIFVNDAHRIVSRRGENRLAEESKIFFYSDPGNKPSNRSKKMKK
jgi:hypothetical protein